MRWVIFLILFIQHATRVIVARTKSLDAQTFHSRTWGKHDPVMKAYTNKHFTSHFVNIKFSKLGTLLTAKPNATGCRCLLGCFINMYSTSYFSKADECGFLHG
jgi:hypothetical protein